MEIVPAKKRRRPKSMAGHRVVAVADIDNVPTPAYVQFLKTALADRRTLFFDLGTNGPKILARIRRIMKERNITGAKLMGRMGIKGKAAGPYVGFPTHDDPSYGVSPKTSTLLKIFAALEEN